MQLRNLLKMGQKPLVLGAMGVLVSNSFAEWQSLARGTDLVRNASQKIGFSVNVTRTAKQQVTVTVPGYDLKTVEVEGQKYSVVTMAEFPGLTEAGNPDVPRVAANFLIPDGMVPTANVVDSEFVDIQLEHPLISSKGHMTRDVNPETVPYTFSDVYQKDAFFPEMVMASVSEPFTMHNVDGVNIHFNFFQYNPVTKVLRIHKNVTLEMDNSVPVTRTAPKSVPSFIGHALERSFINYEVMQEPLNLHNTDETGRMVIITHDDFADAMKPFVDWKTKSGMTVKMVKMSEVGTTAEDIKAFVQGEFDAGGLSFLHLVGDVEQIPTLRGTVERAHSDQSYGLLAGNDWFLDIIVSRFSAKTADQVAYQVSKTVNYESKPEVGAAWYKMGMGIASNEGNPPDWDYADKLREGLMAFTYTDVDKIYDPKGNQQMVADGVNAGRSVINYIGHGSETTWVSSRFSVSDIYKLSNGNALPYIWSVACVNGAFAGTRESFAEAWLNAGDKDNVKGAVAVAAASTNMQWIPPLWWQSEANLVLLPSGKNKTFGGLSLGGMSKIAEKYGPTSKSFKMFVEQTNNFGDGSLKVRYDSPAAVKVNNITVEGDAVEVAVSAGDRSAEGLIVTMYNSTLDDVQTVRTNERGTAKFELGGRNATDFAVTVTGSNVVPAVDVAVKAAASAENFEKLYNK
ncbi:MAG: hypothetical protein H3C47_13660 [Candidatus Cloacimonetes bacterium]|nr:hypothetical protein [Candidatus Cloacimonadota bacterium]